MLRRDLSKAHWTIDGDGPKGRVHVEAAVPTCVHSALERASAAPALDSDDGEAATAWIGTTAWRYRGRFAVEPELLAHERVDLVCERLDTAVEVSLNGMPFGRVANEHHPHRFDARWSLRAGTNELLCAFDPPLSTVESVARRLGRRPVNGDWGAFHYLRKAASDFGWDWGPRVRTSGITGSLALEAWSGVRIEAIRPLVHRADSERADVEVHVDLEWTAPRPAVVRARLCGAVAEVAVRAGAESHRVVVHLAIERPELWWPRGLGPATLHELAVEVEAEGVEPCRASRRVGLRTVELDTSRDALGRAFRVRVNGRVVQCRGANVVPADGLPAHDGAREEALVAEACAAHMNMLRVWGGGRFGSDAFYDACDRAGMLLWQDFMLACAAYPEEPPFPQRIEREARHQVARLASHPSVVLWCGGNEVEVAMRCWEDFGARLAPGTPWGRRYLHEDLPRIVAELDPTRPYWPDSPWSGTIELDPNDAGHGDRHTWDLGHEQYRDLVPRFASEFGQQSPPCLTTIVEALGRLPETFDDPALASRQRGGGGDERWYDAALRDRFRPPAGFREKHWLTQLLQARAMWIACTWLRVHPETCGGTLVWQLNDVWTGHSWSVLDVALRRKPAWHALRRAYAPRLACLHPDESGRLRVHLVHEGAQPWNAACTLRRVGADGRMLAEHACAVTVAPDNAACIDDLPPSLLEPHDAARELLVLDVDGLRDTWTFRRDRELAFETPRAEVVVGGTIADAPGVAVTVHARTILRELVLLADQVGPEARTDSGLVTLLPGEKHVFVVERVEHVDEASARAALRTADGLVGA